MRDDLRRGAAVAQTLREPGEFRCRLLGQRLPGQPRLQLVRVGKGPFEPTQLSGIGEIVEPDLAGVADRVRPIGVYLDAREVADDKQRRVLQRRRIALELRDGRFQVLAAALVFPTEAAAQPSPPVVFVAPFPKAYHSPFGSASVGVSSPRRSQRSRK